MNLKDLLIKIVDIFNREFDDFPIHEFPELSKLTVIQAHYLEAIARMDNPTISKLTKELHVSKPTVSVIVDKLVKSGYLEKEQSDQDRRIKDLRLSKEGKELYEIYKMHDDKTYSGFIKKIQKVLDKKDLEKLMEILNRLVNSL